MVSQQYVLFAKCNLNGCDWFRNFANYRYRTYSLRTGRPLSLRQLFPKKYRFIVKAARRQLKAKLHILGQSLDENALLYDKKKKRFHKGVLKLRLSPQRLQPNHFALKRKQDGLYVSYIAEFDTSLTVPFDNAKVINVDIRVQKARILARAEAFVERWRRAWENTAQNNNIVGFGDLYHPGFRDVKRRRSRRAFLAYKKKVARLLPWIRVNISKFRAKRAGPTGITVSFLQYYSSPTLYDIGRKTLVLKEYKGKLKIWRSSWAKAKGGQISAWARCWKGKKFKERQWKRGDANVLKVVRAGRKIRSISCQSEEGGYENHKERVTLELYPNGRLFRLSIFESMDISAETDLEVRCYDPVGTMLKSCSRYKVVPATDTGPTMKGTPKSTKASKRRTMRLFRRYLATINRLQTKKGLPKSFRCFR